MNPEPIYSEHAFSCQLDEFDDQGGSYVGVIQVY
jgi:hypothetical protein